MKNEKKFTSQLTLGTALALALALAVACGEKEPPVPPVIEPPKPEPKPLVVDYYLGSLFGFEGGVRNGDVQENTATTTYYNLPLFFGTEQEWWDNLVEEFAHSGLDYAMANCRGRLPDAAKRVDHGDPTHLTRLIEAMERRGVADKFKIAIFDDCPASWAAARNQDMGHGYVDKYPAGAYNYPLDNLDGEDGIYKYIWDYNIKLAFQTVPDKYRFKYNGRPVLYLWSVNNFIDPSGTVHGKLSPILKRLRDDFKAEFGADPFIVVDRAFQDRDRTVAHPVVDGINDWFGMDNPYTVRTVNDVTFGVAIPGFSINDRQGNRMFVDADRGKRLSGSLEALARAGSDIVLVEGFTDVYENAALWRSTDKTYYEYPNQRLNILRRYNRNPEVVWPRARRIEAEGCDSFSDNTPNGGAYVFRRDGDIDIAKCGDTHGGWHVADASAGEWLRWRELPFRAANTSLSIRYRSTAAAEVSFTAGEVAGAKTALPSTGGTWTTAVAGSVAFEDNGLHDLTLKIESGTVEINWFEMSADK